MITHDDLKIATTEILDSLRPTFNRDLTLAHDDLVRDIVNGDCELDNYYTPGEFALDNDGYDTYDEYIADVTSDRVKDWCDNILEKLNETMDHSAEYYMPELVYTVDIMNYFSDNISEVEDAHHDIGVVGSLSDQISVAVAYARERELINHISELSELFEDTTALENELEL